MGPDAQPVGHLTYTGWVQRRLGRSGGCGHGSVRSRQRRRWFYSHPGFMLRARGPQAQPGAHHLWPRSRRKRTRRRALREPHRARHSGIARCNVWAWHRRHRHGSCSESTLRPRGRRRPRSPTYWLARSPPSRWGCRSRLRRRCSQHGRSARITWPPRRARMARSARRLVVCVAVRRVVEHQHGRVTEPLRRGRWPSTRGRRIRTDEPCPSRLRQTL